MTILDTTRRNAPFIGVIFAIAVTAAALILALVALLMRMG
jgi:hypothetical protein